jgi:hypothetical protein
MRKQLPIYENYRYRRKPVVEKVNQNHGRYV